MTKHGFGYLSSLEESLYAARKKKTFPARSHVGDVFQAEQKTLPNGDVTVRGVVAMPVVIQPKQLTHTAPVHSSPAVRLWKQRAKWGLPAVG